jgi:hypothetical protein
MVRRKNRAVHRHECLLANFHSPVAVNHHIRPKPNPTRNPYRSTPRIQLHPLIEFARMGDFHASIQSPGVIWPERYSGTNVTRTVQVQPPTRQLPPPPPLNHSRDCHVYSVADIYYVKSSCAKVRRSRLA